LIEIGIGLGRNGKFALIEFTQGISYIQTDLISFATVWMTLFLSQSSQYGSGCVVDTFLYGTRERFSVCPLLCLNSFLTTACTYQSSLPCCGVHLSSSNICEWVILF